ncbi:ALS2 [Acanthosepion pharaonis]|uniref:ALS2 n=1 Tax=Acanthosepion pharaonis TaxID=158019 RepID=A0A812AS61_ACAPH|nr:ALS2 [Sepia pharaonis]
MDNDLHSEDEKDGIVCLWKGFHSDIKIQTFDAFAHKIIKRISLGFEHGLFLSTEKEVFVVGSNSHHQLGLGNLTEPSIDSPRLLDYFTGKEILEISCGKAYSAVISASGDAYMWGDSGSGQCGVGRKEDVLTPELVSFSIQEDKCKHGVPLPEEKIHVRKVACGHTHTLAITNRGELWAWGSGMGLGLGDKKEALVPERVQELSDSNVLDIACGMAHSLALVEKHGHVTTPRKSISDMKYHKYYPPTCAKCNQEIYSYIETNDLCIISDEHTCTKKVEKKSTPKANEDAKSEQTSSVTSSPLKSEQMSSVTSSPLKSEQVSSVASSPLKSEQVSSVASSPLKSEQVTNVASSPLKSEQVSSVASSPLKSEQVSNVASSPLKSGPESPVAATDLNQSATLSPSPTITRLSDNQTDSISLKDEGDSISQDQSYSQSSHMSTSSTTEDIVQKNKSHILDEEEAREYLAKQMNDQDANGGDASCQHPIKTRLENLFTSVPETSVAVVQQVTDLTNRAISTFRSSVGSMADSFGFVSGQHIDLDGLSKSSSLDSNLHSDTDSPSMSRRDSVFTYDSPLSEDMWRRRSGSNDDALSDRTDSHSSLRALWRRSKKLEKERQSHKKDDKSSTSSPHLEPLPYFETEVWSWGKNSKGQLGLGDTIDRDKPCCIRILNSKNSTKIIAGPQHCLALTAYSQVYSWGSNSHGQLGYSESSTVPSPVKFVANCLVWDIAAGENHSLFLTDSGGFHPDVYYSGKHPSDSKTTYSSMIKTTKPVALNSLRKSGWIRSLVAGGSTCACLVGKSSSGQTATAFELALSERNFYFHLNKIASKFLKPLKTSVFFCSMDVNPYKPTFNNLVESFLHLTNKIGENCVELTRLIRGNEDITQCHMFQQSNNLLKVFKNYSHCFGDMAAINGFEFCAKLGSSYFEKIQIVFADILDETNTEKINFASALQRIMQYPLRRLKEYGHMADKLSMGYPLDSEMRSFLSGISIAWDSLKLASNEEHKQADITRLFWEASTQRLVESLRTPERRLLRDTKQHPLTQASAGRFSVHNFLLFNDIFVHVHGSSITIFPLETVWVDTSTEIEQTQDTLVIIVPEDIFVLTAASLASKAEWLMELNQAINNCYRPPRSASVSGSSRVEANRLTPPLVRQAQYKFSKHAIFKDATYNGTWMKAKIHGHGEMKWLDGRRYIGKFINGLQHGNGKYIVPKGECEEIYEGSWKDGKMNGLGSVIYPNGDRYDGYFKDGQKFGHGVFRQGKHLASVASVYIGEWMADKRCGYGVLDDVLRGEKYMGLWQDDNRHGNGIVVTLDGMYFEGNFVQGKLSGFGLMLTDDDSCYEGEFSGITQLNGKGTLRLPNGDRIDGHFSGSWNEGLKVNGTFHKGMAQDSLKKTGHVCGIQSKTYGSLSVTADRKWEDIFSHCKAMLGYTGEGKADTGKAWESVAVMITRGKKTLNDREFNSPSKMRMMSSTLEELEKIPPYSEGRITLEYYHKIARYLAMAFDTKFHPVGKLIDGLVDVFRAAYIGIGAHPRLLPHAVQEIKSYVKRIYKVIRILFPDLPSSSKPVRIYSIKTPPPPADENESVIEQDFMTNNEKHNSEVVTPALLLHPLLLPKIYPPLFDLYALFNDKEDEKYWERVQKLNRQGDMALMAYLGIDQKFWLIEDNLFQGNRQKLSEIRDHCYASAVEMLQQISTAFSPCEKLAVIRRTFLEITKAVQITLGNDYIWCMDDLFPIFQYVVVRSKIQHLGAEIHLIDDLMERHLEHGELGIMFTTLKACYFQIQHEKMPT